MAQFQGIIAPHPLSILPHEANREVINKYEELIKEYLELTKKISEWQPDTIIIISPRGMCYLDGISINNPKANQYVARLEEIKQKDMYFETDKSMIHSILKRSKEAQLPTIDSDNPTLDRGAIVPLFYLTKGLEKQPELIHLNMGHLSPEKHFKLGQIIKEIAEQTDKKILFIAAADLSHTLTKDSPGGYYSGAKQFEKELRQDLATQNYEAITLYDIFELDEIKEAAIRPISTLVGFLQNSPHKFTEHSYCAPEGVGYLLASTF